MHSLINSLNSVHPGLIGNNFNSIFHAVFRTNFTQYWLHHYQPALSHLSLFLHARTNPSFFILTGELSTLAKLLLLKLCRVALLPATLTCLCSAVCGLCAHTNSLTSYQATNNMLPCFIYASLLTGELKAAVLTKTSICSCRLAEVNTVLSLCFGLCSLVSLNMTQHIFHPIGALPELWPPALPSSEIKCLNHLPTSAKLKKNDLPRVISINQGK